MRRYVIRVGLNLSIHAIDNFNPYAVLIWFLIWN